MQMMCTDKIRAIEYGRFSAIRYAARASAIFAEASSLGFVN